MKDLIKRLQEVSKGMPSILVDFPNSRFVNSDSILDAIRISKRQKITFNHGKTTYKIKPYLEVIDYMIRMIKWQESGKNLQDGRGFTQKEIKSNSDNKYRKPVGFRLDPQAVKQKKLLGDMF